MKEIVRQRVRQTSLSIVKNSIQAIRKKDITKTGCRLLENGKISIAGGLGKVCEEELFEKAREFIADAADYPVEPSENLRHKTEFKNFGISDANLCERIQTILDRARERHPNFFLSNKVNLTSYDYSISNENGLDLSYYDCFVTLSFLIKENTSTGIMDTFFGVTERNLDVEKVVSAIDHIINAYENKLELPDEKLPVVIDQSHLTRLFLRDLNGKIMGNGASLFQNQIGEKVFSDNFTLKIANDPEETFSPAFDAEGVIAEPYLGILIENGLIKRPYTDKRTAKQFDFENTGCASGAYDSVPSLGTCMLEIAHSGKTLQELLNGRKGVLVAIASGGDFTAEGKYATPVQVSYLTDGEKLLGRLPEITISGSIFDFFGKNFIGISSDKIYEAGNERLAVVGLDIKKL
ncbi:MAG: hypothetical protein Kow0029_17020 [Candidatus Rifleibacteriota bacterium]